MTSVMIACGEPSGDLYAGALARELLRVRPGTRVVGSGAICSGPAPNWLAITAPERDGSCRGRQVLPRA
jgi:hypothetical protein